MCGYVYVWVLECVGVCMCGPLNLWMCECACVCGFCNVWVCV